MHFFETFAHLFHPRRSNNHRPKVLHPEALSYFAVIALVFSVVLNTSPQYFRPLEKVLGYASNISVDQVISFTNTERAKQGLQEVVFSDVLTQAAAAKGKDMFANQYWAHTSPAGKEPWAFITEAGYSYRVAGENLARDFSASDQVVAAWMASPTHRANIVNDRYTEIGVAVVDGTLDGVATTLVVQMFGAPRVQVAQVAPAAAQAEIGAASSTPASESLSTTAPNAEVSVTPSAPTGSTVLGGSVLPETLLNSPLVSPMQLTKAFFLSILFVLLATLAYDLAIIESRNTVRFVGKNIAHILLLLVVMFLVVFFKGGVIG